MSRAKREEGFEGPTIIEGVVMLLDLYRDLLALAIWRGVGKRLPREAYEVNSPM